NRIEMREESRRIHRVERYGYDGQDVYTDYDANYNWQRRYLRGDKTDQVFAYISDRERPGLQLAWYITDRQGAGRTLLNAQGQAVERWYYTAFGLPERALQNQNYVDNYQIYNRYFYTGREYQYRAPQDGFGLELQYNRARMYDPYSGRWMEEDQNG